MIDERSHFYWNWNPSCAARHAAGRSIEQLKVMLARRARGCTPSFWTFRISGSPRLPTSIRSKTWKSPAPWPMPQRASILTGSCSSTIA